MVNDYIKFLPYIEAVEYVAASSAGLIRPLTLTEWNDMDRDWVELVWDTWQVIQDIQNEQVEGSQETSTFKPPTVQESLAGMSEIGM